MDKVIQSGFFDPQWYIDTYPDVASAGVQPLEHFVRFGSDEGRSPGPDFDSEWYLDQYPDVASAGLIPLMHYIEYGAAEGRLPKGTTLHHGALEAASRTLSTIVDCEPELLTSPQFDNLRKLVIHDGKAKGRVFHVLRQVIDSLSHAPNHVVFVPWLVHGGADLAAVHAVRALVETHGAESALMIVSDHFRMDAREWLPKATEVRVLSEFCQDLDFCDRVSLVELIIRALKPYNVLNVNSAAAWEVIKHKGRALSNQIDLFGMFFCRDYDVRDRPAGYADQYFRECLPNLARLYFDNSTFMHDLSEDYGVPQSLRKKLTVLKQPASLQTGIVTRQRRSRDSLKVLWAGRFTRQKNIDLLMRIIEMSPDVAFDIWGRGDDAEQQNLITWSERQSNVTLRGGFPSTAALPFVEYDAFLYTSLWDGIPTILIDVASAGMPIVASAVGGIVELVGDYRGYLIADHKNPQPYTDALCQIRNYPADAQRRRDLMLRFVQQQHSWNAYRRALEVTPTFLGALPCLPIT